MFIKKHILKVFKETYLKSLKKKSSSNLMSLYILPKKQKS
jgi:hypothetical protein